MIPPSCIRLQGFATWQARQLYVECNGVIAELMYSPTLHILLRHPSIALRRSQRLLLLSGHRLVERNPASDYPFKTLCASVREDASICMQANFTTRAAAPIIGTACVICLDCIASPRVTKLVIQHSVADRSAHALTTKPLTMVPRSHTALPQRC